METTSAREVGAYLRDLRRRRHLTQQQVADAAGLARNRLALVEAGKANPTLSTLLAVLAAVGGSMNLEDATDRERPPGSLDLDAFLTRFDERPADPT